MPDIKPKKFDPKAFELVDYNDTLSIYVDDLASIEELGPVTHLTFAFVQRCSDCAPQRRIALRLIIPAGARIGFAHQLIAGECDPAVQSSEDRPLH
jgi:hypothetical protein